MIFSAGKFSQKPKEKTFSGAANEPNMFSAVPTNFNFQKPDQKHDLSQVQMNSRQLS